MFIVILSAVLVLMHLYLWKRLVKDTTRPGRTRWVLTAALVGLGALLIATLILEMSEPTWLAWPGFLWLGLIFYLFLTLVVLEPGRLALRRWVKRAPQPAAGTEASRDDTPAVNRRMFLSRAGAVAAGAASVGVVGVGMAIATRSTRPIAGAGAPAPTGCGVQRISARRGVGYPPRSAGGPCAHRADRRG